MLRLLVTLFIITSFPLLSLSRSPDVEFSWFVATPLCEKFDIHFEKFLREQHIVHNTDRRINGEQLAQPILEPMIQPWISGPSTADQLRESECFQESIEYFKISLTETHDNFTGLGIIRLRSPIGLVVNENVGEYIRLLMKESLQYAKSCWPKEHWVYENILHCVEKNSRGVVCGSRTQDHNYRFSWLWGMQDVIIPRLVFDSEHTKTENLRFITDELYKAKKIAEKNDMNITNIIPALSLTELSSRSQSNVTKTSDDNFEFEAFRNIIDGGIDKILLTGTYNFFDSKENCEQFSIYLKDVLGPALNATRKYKRKTTWLMGPTLLYVHKQFASKLVNSQSTCRPLHILILCICLYATHLLIYA